MYLYQHSDLDAKQYREKMRTVSPQAERHFVSTYDQAINTGMARGIEKGRQEGIEKGRDKRVLKRADKKLLYLC